MNDPFQNRLAQAIEMRKTTAAELARKSGISKSRISHYLSGHYEAKQTAIYQLALALNVSEAWLMGFDVSPERQRPAAPKAAEPSDRLIQKLNRLDEIDRAKIEERIDVLLENEKYKKKEVG